MGSDLFQNQQVPGNITSFRHGTGGCSYA
jgi:hypothetical protein